MRRKRWEVGNAALASLLGSGLALGWGCASRDPSISSLSLQEELEFGKTAAAQLSQQISVVDDESLREYVQEIGARLAERSPRQELEYSFDIVDLDLPHAFTLPGGRVYVSRGLLALLNGEDELANALAHEVGHVAARHGQVSAWRSAVLGRPDLGPIAAHSPDEEDEADEIAQKIALEAGFDPAGLGSLLRALERHETAREKERIRRASLLDSHPITPRRLEQALSRAATLAADATRSEPTPRERFLRRLEGLVVGDDPRQGLFVEPNYFVHPDLDFRVRFPEGWATLNAASFLRGEDGPVRIEFRLEGEGDDPKRAAQAYFAERREQQRKAREAGEDGPEELQRTKQGLRRMRRGVVGYAVEALADGGAAELFIYWIPLRGKMFRMECVMAAGLRSAYIDECRTTAASLRPLRRQDRERIQRVTLALERAHGDETLREFCDRTGNAWSVETTAAANALSLPYDLEDGQLLKYARSVTYEPAEPSEDASARR